jgi:hypothetical protein
VELPGKWKLGSLLLLMQMQLLKLLRLAKKSFCKGFELTVFGLIFKEGIQEWRGTFELQHRDCCCCLLLLLLLLLIISLLLASSNKVPVGPVTKH